MTDLTMDFSTNDIVIENGDMSLVDGVDAIEQDLQQQLQVWLGEWFLDTTIGIPYRQQILVKNPNLDIVQAILVNAAVNVPGVQVINETEFAYEPTNRVLDVQMQGQTSNGQTIVAQTTINPQPQLATIEGTNT